MDIVERVVDVTEPVEPVGGARDPIRLGGELLRHPRHKRDCGAVGGPPYAARNASWHGRHHARIPGMRNRRNVHLWDSVDGPDEGELVRRRRERDTADVVAEAL